MPDLPLALSAAVAHLRAKAGDRTGTIAILVPGEANGVLARQSLALAGPAIRVEPWTPDGLVRHLGELALVGRRPEPGGWRQATIGVLVRQLSIRGALGAHGDTLSLPGWREVITDATASLEMAGIDAAALRAHPPADASLAERAALLATLLEALADRRREEGLYAPQELAAEALKALATGTAPACRIVGVAILGDTRLARGAFEVLRAFLRDRPAVRIDVPPLSALPREPSGLAAAAPHAEIVEVSPAPGALGQVQARLFRAPAGSPIAPDDSLLLARAPDDVREVREAARAVQDAVLAGTPLDRIAVVLASTERADVWWAELARVGLPATWLTGPSLAREPSARFVRLVADVAAGDDTVKRWYDLLRQPGLRLRARLGPPGTAGRGRWRRILESCGAVSGTTTILNAVTAWSAARDPERETTPKDQEAAASLAVAMGTIAAELAPMRGPSPLGTHAGRLADFLNGWWARSRDREQVLQLLRGWAASTAGFPFTLREASEELAQAFAGTTALEGSLGDAALRVLSPMALLGGTFDVVVMPGLAHGRFPAEPRDPPLLPDALARHLNAALGADLPLSAQVRAEDRRRFAAAVASCRGRLVLSWPDTDLLDGKPRLPGELALEAVSAALGRRAGYREAEARAVRVGSRARPHVDDASRALGSVEFLLARAARDRAGAVGWLAAEATSRRLLALQRSPWRLATTGVRDAWGGEVPRDVLPCPGLDGAPLRLGALVELLGDPSSFFFRRALGAWPASKLPDGLDLLDSYGLRDRLVAAIREAMETAGPLDADVMTAWTASLDALAVHVPDLEAADRALADAVARSTWQNARGHLAAHRGPALTLPPTVLVDGLPWALEGAVGHRVRDAVVDLSSKAWKPDADISPGTLLAALAAQRSGLPVARAVGAGLDTIFAVPLVDAFPILRARLQLASQRANAGEWPWGGKGTFRLGDEEPE